jgi:ubiquinone/menaquinone biosynthesis C-methylase UbiE
MTLLRKTYKASGLHDRWEDVYRPDLNQKKFNDAIMNRIVSYLNLGPGSLVLDAGCGAGDHCTRIGQKGFRCVGIDLSEYALQTASARIAASNLKTRIALSLGALEAIPLKDKTFDAIHCRGVLMHIPEWKKALSELCRVLRIGGRIAILESNDRSVESSIVLGMRKVRRTKSKLIKTDDGLEFWSEERGSPFVVRVANLNSLKKELLAHDVRIIKTCATEFWDINRFPSGLLRKSTVVFNRLYFHLNRLHRLSSGNLIIGEKI